MTTQHDPDEHGTIPTTGPIPIGQHRVTAMAADTAATLDLDAARPRTAADVEAVAGLRKAGKSNLLSDRLSRPTLRSVVLGLWFYTKRTSIDEVDEKLAIYRADPLTDDQVADLGPHEAHITETVIADRYSDEEVRRIAALDLDLRWTQLGPDAQRKARDDAGQPYFGRWWMRSGRMLEYVTDRLFMGVMCFFLGAMAYAMFTADGPTRGAAALPVGLATAAFSVMVFFIIATIVAPHMIKYGQHLQVMDVDRHKLNTPKRVGLFILNETFVYHLGRSGFRYAVWRTWRDAVESWRKGEFFTGYVAYNEGDKPDGKGWTMRRAIRRAGWTTEE